MTALNMLLALCSSNVLICAGMFHMNLVCQALLLHFPLLAMVWHICQT